MPDVSKAGARPRFCLTLHTAEHVCRAVYLGSTCPASGTPHAQTQTSSLNHRPEKKKKTAKTRCKMCSFPPSFYRSSEHYTTKMLTAGHRGQSISRQEGKDSGSVKWGKQKQNTKNEHEFLYGVISTVFKLVRRSKTGSCAAVAWRGLSLRRDRVPLWEVRFGTWTSTGSVPVHLAQSLGGAVARGSRGAAQSGSARGRRAYLLSRLQTAVHRPRE